MSPDFPKKVFIAGLGGVGMSALAEWLNLQGVQVRGSDRDPSQATLAPLCAAGIEVVPQDGAGLRADETFVYSTAIEKDNPDWLAAEKMSLPTLHRSEIIAWKAEALKVVALAGTAGKTTMTAMLGWVLEQSGAEPNVLIGGVVPAWADEHHLGAAKVGHSPYLVLEADESDRSLLHFKPDWAVISNISQDHFSFEESAALFRDFCDHVSRGLILGPGVFEILEQVRPLSSSDLDIIRLEDQSLSDGHLTFMEEEISLRVPGLHNAWNARMSAECANRLGVSVADICKALTTFGGVYRRLEHLGDFSGVQVFDDYAHNTAKMKAAMETLQNRYESIIIIWRPHGFAALRNMFDPLVDMFSEAIRDADRLFILPVFYAGGTTDQTMNSDKLVDAVIARGQKNIEWVEGYEDIKQWIKESSSAFKALLGMGARDPELRRFLDSLSSPPFEGGGDP